MKTDFINQLACPFCGGDLEATVRHPAMGAEIEYGILTCGCREFPIVAGIPIFKGEGRLQVMSQIEDSVKIIGPKVKDLTALIHAGNYEKALLQLLVLPSQRWTSKLMTLSEAVPGRIKGAIQALADFSWSRQQRKWRGLFIDAQPATTALDMFDFFYRRSMPSEVYHYFSCRFAQPRHLVGLSLASLLPASKKPILDLACGVGHFMHYWLKSNPGQQVIGVDRNFFQLYIAKYYVAPGGEFVCSDADVRLPFISKVFCGVFCSDAFHCFLRRLQCAEEMRRVVELGGLIVLSRFGNSQVEPREGYELTADGYLRLFDGLHTRMVSEQDLLEDYLMGRGPQLEKQGEITDLTAHKWLCLVASDSPSHFRNFGEFQTWPHAFGTLKLNPLYHEKGRDASGKVTVELEFPSPWYEFENSGCLSYMPKTAEFASKILDDMKAGIRSPEMEKLVRQCVVIGMPEHYSRADGT